MRAIEVTKHFSRISSFTKRRFFLYSPKWGSIKKFEKLVTEKLDEDLKKKRTKVRHSASTETYWLQYSPMEEEKFYLFEAKLKSLFLSSSLDIKFYSLRLISEENFYLLNEHLVRLDTLLNAKIYKGRKRENPYDRTSKVGKIVTRRLNASTDHWKRAFGRAIKAHGGDLRGEVLASEIGVIDTEEN